MLADLADSVEEFDRDLLAQRITAQEEKIKGLQGNLLDRAIERLDHYKQVDSHLQGTAMH